MLLYIATLATTKCDQVASTPEDPELATETVMASMEDQQLLQSTKLSNAITKFESSLYGSYRLALSACSTQTTERSHMSESGRGKLFLSVRYRIYIQY